MGWLELGRPRQRDERPRVCALTVFDDGTGPAALYAGGVFGSAIDSGDSYLAKWGCPVTPSGTVYCTAGTTTNGCVPAISGTGSASASAGSGFAISIADVEGQTSGLLLLRRDGREGDALGRRHELPVRRGALKRMSTQSSGGTAGACDGVFSEDWNAYIAAHPTALGQPFVARRDRLGPGLVQRPAGAEVDQPERRARLPAPALIASQRVWALSPLAPSASDVGVALRWGLGRFSSDSRNSRATVT